MKTYCVYRHTAPNGKMYIGITSKKPEHRWNHGRAYFQNKHFSRAIKAYGWDSFKHEILIVGLSKEEACEKEKELISKYQSNKQEYGYNLSSGGENPAEGTIQSEETKAKRSVSNKGKKRRPETGAAISAAKKGRPNGCLGRKGEQSKKAGVVYQIDETTREVIATYYGYDEMSRITGYAKTPVKESAAGKRKRAYGFLWRYSKRGETYVFV